jgi:hypothetical protein
MTDRPAPRAAGTRRDSLLEILVPCLLIAQFSWNLFATAHEYPSRTEQVMTMTFDFLLIVGLFAYRHAMPQPLFWIALVAGIGLFGLRLLSDHGWWTGHLYYSLS